MIALAGPRAQAILERVFRPRRSHRAVRAGALQLGHLVDGGRVIDEAVVCRGGEAVEINIHGGPAAAEAALGVLVRHGAAVQAAQARAAGSRPFARPHSKWHNPAVAAEMIEALPRARSLLVVSALAHQWSGGLSALAAEGRASAEQLSRAADALALMRRLIEPAEVVLVGRANAGKSTLANALVGRAISIVHDRPGTTRDWVRELALLDGVPVWLTDTAGIWSLPRAGQCGAAAGGVDAEAVRRARRRAEQADLVVLLAPGGPAETPGWLHAKSVLPVASKCDALPPRAAGRDAAPGARGGLRKADPGVPPPMAVSARTGEGLDVLRDAIRRRLGFGNFDPSAPMAFTARQTDLLRRAAERRRRGDEAACRDALGALLAG